MADEDKTEHVTAELNLQLLRSREQEGLLLDALTRVLRLIEQDRTT